MSASSSPAKGTVVTGAGAKESTTYLPLWSSAQALAGNGGGIAVDVAGVVGVADGTAPWLQPITTNMAAIHMQIRLHHGRNLRRFGGLLILRHCCRWSRQATGSRVPSCRQNASGQSLVFPTSAAELSVVVNGSRGVDPAGLSRRQFCARQPPGGSESVPR